MANAQKNPAAGAGNPPVDDKSKDIKPTPPAEVEQPQGLTAAGAAKLVKREVQAVDEDGKPTGKTKLVEVKADEVLDFKEYDDRVVVVTVDGRKLVGKK